MAGERNLTDEQLLAQCRFEAFRGPGPGGQKKNKTSSAVRLTHEPTGIAVIAGESRSQHQNRSSALRRLRHRIALEIRESPAMEIAVGELDVSQKNPDYPRRLGAVLDILSESDFSLSDAAVRIGVSTARLSKFICADEVLWTHVNRERTKRGLGMLR